MLHSFGIQSYIDFHFEIPEVAGNCRRVGITSIFLSFNLQIQEIPVQQYTIIDTEGTKKSISGGVHTHYVLLQFLQQTKCNQSRQREPNMNNQLQPQVYGRLVQSYSNRKQFIARYACMLSKEAAFTDNAIIFHDYAMRFQSCAIHPTCFCKPPWVGQLQLVLHDPFLELPLLFHFFLTSLQYFRARALAWIPSLE